MRIILTIAATALVAASGALAEPQWKHVGTVGNRHIVVVAPADAGNTGVLTQAAEAACVAGQPCIVGFWSDQTAAPNAMPMSRAQQEAMVAQYVRNPASGKTELMFKCISETPASTSIKCLH